MKTKAVHLEKHTVFLLRIRTDPRRDVKHVCGARWVRCYTEVPGLAMILEALKYFGGIRWESGALAVQ